MQSELVNDTVVRLARRKPAHPEAETQADIYMLLTTADLGLGEGDVAKLEAPVADGTRRRIDIEAGHVVIEVKKDVRVGNLVDFEAQLAGYVKQRHAELGSRYVGILTDGTTWRLYNLIGDGLVFVSELALSPSIGTPWPSTVHPARVFHAGRPRHRVLTGRHLRNLLHPRPRGQ